MRQSASNYTLLPGATSPINVKLLFCLCFVRPHVVTRSGLEECHYGSHCKNDQHCGNEGKF